MSIDRLVTEGPIENQRDKSAQGRAADREDWDSSQNESSAKTELMIAEPYHTVIDLRCT